VDLGGGGLRGYDPSITTKDIAAINLEVGRTMTTIGPPASRLSLGAALFADAADAELIPDERQLLGDAGVGLSIRGNLFDRPITLRLDAPVWVSERALSVGGQSTGQTVAWRWAFSLRDLW
jgi:hypothetical protein